MAASLSFFGSRPSLAKMMGASVSQAAPLTWSGRSSPAGAATVAAEPLGAGAVEAAALPLAAGATDALGAGSATL